MKKFDPSLYFITDSTNYTEEEFLFRVEQALKGGVTLLQLREKSKSTREYIEHLRLRGFEFNIISHSYGMILPGGQYVHFLRKGMIW